MATARRRCLNSPDSFCYICGEYIFIGTDNKRQITEFIKSAYKVYFKLELQNVSTYMYKISLVYVLLDLFALNKRSACGENETRTFLLV